MAFEVRVAFRYVGAEVDPNFVTSILAISPSQIQKVGEYKRRRPEQVWSTGAWIIASELADAKPLTEHLDKLLEMLESRSDQIRHLASLGYVGEFFCGFFASTGNLMFDLDPGILSRIAALGVGLRADVYYVGEQA